MAQLALRFKANGHGVFVVSCDHFNVTHTRGEVFDYYRKIGLSEDEFTHLGDVYHQLHRLPEDMGSDVVDWDYLQEFESKYCRRFTLLEMVAMDTLMSGTFHHRDIYYRPKNKNILFKYLEQQCRWLEDVFAKRAFDVAFTINFQYFIKAAAFAMADAKGIPFLMAASCRIKDLHLIFDNFSLGTPQSIIEEMNRLSKSNDECLEATQYIDWLKAERRAAYTDFELTMQTIKTRMSLYVRLKELFWWLTRHQKTVLLIHKRYRGVLKRNFFLPNNLAILRVMLVSIWRSVTYFHHEELSRKDLPKGPFVYFPLHLIPENSVLTLSKTFNEMECLFQLSKTLPIGWKVVVKINPNMLVDSDTHPNRYYLEMSRLPNVQFISPMIPSVEILEKASAVACLSGTALLEGAIFDKPGFRWGHTEFEVIDSIHEFQSEKVRELLGPHSSSNLKYYIQACFNIGLKLDFRLLCHSVHPVATPLSPEQVEEYGRQTTLLEEKILQHVGSASRVYS